MTWKIEFDTSQTEVIGNNLLKVTDTMIGRVTLASVNQVMTRSFDLSRRKMLTGVKLSDDYLKQRMDAEPANDPRHPVATITAFRSGGARSSARPVNLREFAPLQQIAQNNWSNSGVATDSGRLIFPGGGVAGRVEPGSTKIRKGGRIVDRQAIGPNPQANGGRYNNPRKPGSLLPFIPRVGTAAKGPYNVPVGRKQAGISIDIKGSRKTITYAFMALARAGKVDGGNGFLVFKRAPSDHTGKGKLIPIFSLSVWQMFRHVLEKTDVIQLVSDDLSETVVSDLGEAIEQAIFK